MNESNLSQNLSARDRCWIYASTLPFTQFANTYKMDLEGFLKNWKNERHPKVQGNWQILEDHFLLIMANDEEIAVSGCSIDSMQRWVVNFGKKEGVDFLNRLIFYQDNAGRVQGVSRPEFKQKIIQQEVGQETIVFDTTLNSMQDVLDGKFKLQLKDSWHHTLFQQAQA